MATLHHTPLPHAPLTHTPLAVIEVSPDGALWRLRSSDHLFEGLFLDREAAVRHARDEAEGHPGHVVVVKDAA